MSEAFKELFYKLEKTYQSSTPITDFAQIKIEWREKWEPVFNEVEGKAEKYDKQLDELATQEDKILLLEERLRNNEWEQLKDKLGKSDLLPEHIVAYYHELRECKKRLRKAQELKEVKYEQIKKIIDKIRKEAITNNKTLTIKFSGLFHQLEKEFSTEQNKEVLGDE